MHFPNSVNSRGDYAVSKGNGWQTTEKPCSSINKMVQRSYVIFSITRGNLMFETIIFCSQKTRVI